MRRPWSRRLKNCTVAERFQDMSSWSNKQFFSWAEPQCTLSGSKDQISHYTKHTFTCQ